MEFQTCHSIGDAAGTQKKKEKPTDWASNQMSTFRVVPPMCAGNKQRTRPHVWNFKGYIDREEKKTLWPVYQYINTRTRYDCVGSPLISSGASGEEARQNLFRVAKKRIFVSKTQREEAVAVIVLRLRYRRNESLVLYTLHAAGVLFIIDGDFLSLLFNMKNGRESDEGLECQRLPFP